MPSSFLLDNIRSQFRTLKQDGPAAALVRLADIGRVKTSRMFEEVASRTPLGKMLGRAYCGPGIAVTFHEIHADVDAELRTGCDIHQVERVVRALRTTGREIVTLDEGFRRLADPDAKPFALLTFDDAYRDNLTNALPVLERLDAPMALFVPTGMINRDTYAWWLGLRAWILGRDAIDVPPMNRRFECPDLASKLSTLRQVTAWIVASQDNADLLKPVFAGNGIDIAGLVDRYAMTEAELVSMAGHPLVTIGAHTTTHRILSSLAEAEVLAELRNNKAYLETLLGRAVDFLAYPYGTPGTCGEREARAAATAGFRASFTTRPSHLFPDHRRHPHLLPRIDMGFAPQSRAALASRLSGLHRALTSGFGDPVAILA
jgi:peptidoglycan/xylan/chitin deacetylase (PgdA/CDA1 family)